MFRHFIEANLGSGYDYELEVKYLLIRLGFKASLTGNDDRGIDIIAQASTPGNPKFYIQCKYHNKPVGLEAVQEVYTGCALRGNDGYPVVFTSSSITTDAKKSANQLGVEIISRPELADLAYGYETKRVIRKTRYGLMGLMAGLSVKDSTHILNTSKKYIQKVPQKEISTEENDEKELQKKAITQLYEQAQSHEMEIAQLEQQKSKHQQLILELQKQAIILSLDYG